jgi:hypothetical protein
MSREVNMSVTTPFELKLKSNDQYRIEFKKDGYVTQPVTLTSSVGAGWIVLDVLAGLVPIVIDAATGSWMYLSQDNVNATLQKKEATK